MSKWVHIAAATAALVVASSANAAITVFNPNPAVFIPPATGGFLGQVDPSPGATSATLTPFQDVFNFSIAGTPGMTDSQVSTIQLRGSQDIDFTSVMLDGNPYFQIMSDPGSEVWQCCGTSLLNLAPVTLGVGPHSITLIGNLVGSLSGTYSATINIQPVPEPATWAMMLIGFGAIGFAMRRRRATALAAA